MSILGFALGVMFASFGMTYPVALLLLMLAGAFFVLFRDGARVFARVMPVALVAAAFGIVWFGVRDPGPPREIPASPLEAVVVSEPDERENYTRYVVRSGDANTLVFADRHARFEYGDVVRIRGEVTEPENFTDEFDWEAYLAKDDIYYETLYPQIAKVGEEHGIRRSLFAVKNKLLSAMQRVVPEPHAAFLGGITLGAKRAIPKELQERFRTVGITHVVVLSGYNVTIVAETFIRALRPLPQMFGVSFGILGVVLFALMTGATPAIVRASIMAGIVLLGRATGRLYAASRALVVAGFFMVLHSPKILRFDLGFQLSFLATLGLIYLSPLMEKKLHALPSAFGIRDVVAATLSAQLAVLPLILYKIGDLSIVAPIVNALILFFIPATMFFGFMTGIVGAISGVLSIPFGWVSFALLQYELFIVDIFARLPFAKVLVPYFPLPAVMLAYGILAAWARTHAASEDTTRSRRSRF